MVKKKWSQMLIMKLVFLSVFFYMSCYSFGLNDSEDGNPRKIDLKTAVVLAKQSDSKLRKVKFDSKFYKAEHNQAKKNFLPTVTAEVTTSNNFDLLSHPRGSTILTFEGSLDLPLYNRALIYNKNKTESQLIYNRLVCEQRLNDLCKEIISLYYSVLYLKSVVKITDSEYQEAKEMLLLTEKKVKHAKSIPLDVLLAKGLVAKNKYNRKNTRNDYLREKLKLAHKLNLREDIELTTPKTDFIKKISLKKALIIAKRERVDIKVKLLEMKVKKALYEVEKSVYHPKISLFSDIRYDYKNDKTSDTEWSVFLVASMALVDDVNVSTKAGVKKFDYLHKPVDQESLKVTFFGDSNRVKKARTKSEYHSIQDEVRDMRFKIEEDIIEAYHQLIKARDNLKLGKLNYRISKGLLEKVTLEYQIGKKAMEDLIEAKENKGKYNIEYRQAYLNYYLAILNFKWAMGILWKYFLEIEVYDGN